MELGILADCQIELKVYNKQDSSLAIYTNFKYSWLKILDQKILSSIPRQNKIQLFEHLNGFEQLQLPRSDCKTLTMQGQQSMRKPVEPKSAGLEKMIEA